MSSKTADTTVPPSPDEAFSILGNETRLNILQVLGEADERVAFSELRERVGMRDSGQFNYHLTQLVGHFVDQTDDGYGLRQPGKRVIQSVLSGAVTEEPVIEPTPIDHACPYCGAPGEASYSQGRVELYCTECPGLYGQNERASREAAEKGHVGGLSLPPAGVRDRTIDEIVHTASTWCHLELIAWSCDICPRCSALLTHSVNICGDHDSTDGSCGRCGNRHAIHIESRCTNCFHEMSGIFGNYLMGTPELLAFVAQQGLDPISEGIEWGAEWGEEILSEEPFEARFTTDVDDERVSLTVGADLSVVDVARQPLS